MIVFELTRTGDLTSPLTVVKLGVLDHVMFSAGQSTAQLMVTTFSDLEFEQDMTLRLVVTERAGHYVAGSPSSATVLVLDDDIPEMRAYAETTQVRINENGKVYAWRAILEADERPHNRLLRINIFVANYLLEKKSVSAASADDVTFLVPGGNVDDEVPASIPEKDLKVFTESSLVR